ncbi:MAG TPA: sulfotransferase [Spongiibacteraceae bacterium]|jgi:hypothetical protein|nr:sulfotransferase [Spongiibacteraceae bacterium]HUH37466.1 sulfotransferase [Spongiibacteraceae bacterium]
MSGDTFRDASGRWQAPPHPAWLETLNREGEHFDLSSVIPLDEASLCHSACRSTGLDDFGGDEWREPFAVLCRALEEEAQLTTMGRLMARSDMLVWLSTRLQVVDLLKRHPEIRDQPITAPMFIVGLPRSGTSILFELLAQDPAVGVPLIWEAMFPCPAPEPDTYTSDPRIARAHGLVSQWARVVPEFATMHEMGGQIPAECGLLMAPTFISDHIASLHNAPSYGALFAAADMQPVYEFHKTMLQILQWKNPRQRWLLKAPEHQNHLEVLLKVYPDARIVQTHRDPIKCMASTTSLLGALLWMRSDAPFDSTAFEDIVLGAATAQRLENLMAQRDSGVVPAANIADSRYQDLMDDPLACVEGIYRHFGMSLSDAVRQRMLDYLAHKPKGKFGAHKYQIDSAAAARDRALFANYQSRYGVPDEM